MNKLDRKEIIYYGIFFGGIWGILEATLGYVLNLIPSGISGAIMFPIAFALMMNAYKRTGSIKVLRIMTVIAAGIKLTNLALPFLPVVKVANPALAILLEGLAISSLIAVTIHKKKPMTFKTILAASMSWRVIYLAETVVLFYMDIPSRVIKGGFSTISEYLIFGLINAVLIFGYVKLLNRSKSENNGLIVKNEKRLSPVFSAIPLVVAIGAQYLVMQ